MNVRGADRMEEFVEFTHDFFFVIKYKLLPHYSKRNVTTNPSKRNVSTKP